MSVKRSKWSGKFGFVIAATGSAVGLGNLWKFPYITWENGGGIFIVIYLLCIVFIGLPIMISEILIGKLTQKNPFGAFKALGGKNSPFRFVGLLGILSAFVILSYYSVIAGWGIEYQIKSINNEFSNVSLKDMDILLTKDVPKLQSEGSHVSIKSINTRILNSSENISMQIKKKAFIDTLTHDLSKDIKQNILMDAGIFKSSKSKDVDRLFKENMDQLHSKLIENKKIEPWHNAFFVQKTEQDDYPQWIQKAFRPMYSSYMFQKFTSDPNKMILWHTVIMLVTLIVLLGGIRNGIERVSIFGMSILIILLVILMGNSLISDTQNQGVNFLLSGKPERISWNSFWEALGHSFFTLSLGLGAIMTYGSYLDKKINPISTGIAITLMDTTIAIVACLTIFPLIFVHSLQPAGGGVGILFTTLPLEFLKFKGGQYFSMIFYLLVFIAAITSAISLLEVVVTYFVEQIKLKRSQSVMLAALLVYLLGVPSAYDLDFLGRMDKIATNVMLPLGGFFIAFFVGHKMDMELFKKEFFKNEFSLKFFHLFKITIKYITPLLIFILIIKLVYGLFWF